jgi:hypothetical protein
MIMQMMQKIRLTQRVLSEVRAAVTAPVAVAIVFSPDFSVETR